VNIADTWDYGKSFVGARFLGVRVPLVVSMVVTNRCNYSCGYCDRWDGRGYQLTTSDILSMMDEMASMGTRRLIFTGGEPLIRKDIFDLMRRAVTLGFKVNLNSNGTLVPRYVDQLAHLDGLTISIDGDRETHDHVRGDGAFDAAVEAVRAARQHTGLKIRLSAVISSVSIGGEDVLLDMAEREGIDVFFQPAEHRVLGGEGVNPLAPPIAEYRETIDHLIRRKQAGAPIANSLGALRYLRSWPDGPALKCAGAKLFCRVDHDGQVMICGRMGGYEERYSALKLGFREAFLRLHEARCPTCWCASRIEVNQAFALRTDAVAGLVRAGQ
jgi:MoaA/NifB/PqqE/SkfB family radical SAM enzyme